MSALTPALLEGSTVLCFTDFKMHFYQFMISEMGMHLKINGVVHAAVFPVLVVYRGVFYNWCPIKITRHT